MANQWFSAAPIYDGGHLQPSPSGQYRFPQRVSTEAEHAEVEAMKAMLPKWQALYRAANTLMNYSMVDEREEPECCFSPDNTK